MFARMFLCCPSQHPVKVRETSLIGIVVFSVFCLFSDRSDEQLQAEEFAVISPIPVGRPVIRPLFNDVFTRFHYFADAAACMDSRPMTVFRASSDASCRGC
jgi:hypothetical protein